MKKIIVQLTFLISFIAGDKLFACSCIGQRNVKEEIKHAEAVLVGTIVSKEVVYLIDSTVLALFPNDSLMNNSPMTKIPVARYRLLVQDSYKGNISSDTVIIYTGIGGGDCGVRFKTGERYIVYGESESYFDHLKNTINFPNATNSFWTNICLRTMPYAEEERTEIEKYAVRKQLSKKDQDAGIFFELESMPVFKNGGDEGLKKFIRENLHYPANGECVTGRVYVEFTVDTLGNTKDINIKKGITASTNEEAIKVVKLLEFIPGKRNGRPAEMKMILPISFTFENKK